MITVKNLTYAPLILNLATSGRSLYMRPREVHSINENEVSEEVRSAAKQGFVQLTYLAVPSKTSSKVPSVPVKVGKSKSKKGR